MISELVAHSSILKVLKMMAVEHRSPELMERLGHTSKASASEWYPWICFHSPKFYRRCRIGFPPLWKV